MNEPQSKLEKRVQPNAKSNYNKTDQGYLDLRLEASLLRFQEEQLNDVVKDDDAAAPVHLWNNLIAIGLNTPEKEKVIVGDSAIPNHTLTLTRTTESQNIQSFWKRFVSFSSQQCWNGGKQTSVQHMPQAADILADGLKACKKADGASWQEWDAGSALLFWRWPKDYIETARTRIALMIDSDPPSNQDRQPPYEEDEVRIKVKAKLEKVLATRYIELVDIALIEVLMFMFHVQKGPDDIRLVYDGTKSGLNASVYALWFALPTIDRMSRWVIAGAWLADNDYGKMFLNFPLHPDLRKYCGVDLSQLFPELIKDGKDSVIAQWIQNAMSLRGFPYGSV
jgi:hypothetical protein